LICYIKIVLLFIVDFVKKEQITCSFLFSYLIAIEESLRILINVSSTRIRLIFYEFMGDFFVGRGNIMSLTSEIGAPYKMPPDISR